MSFEEHQQARRAEGGKSDGVSAIAAERARQRSEERWSPAHDDQYYMNELAWAAICYAAPTRIQVLDEVGAGDPWPWSKEWDKREKHDRRRCLVIAGALIAAEIDRLDRATLDRVAKSQVTPRGGDAAHPPKKEQTVATKPMPKRRVPDRFRIQLDVEIDLNEYEDRADIEAIFASEAKNVGAPMPDPIEFLLQVVTGHEYRPGTLRIKGHRRFPDAPPPPDPRDER